MKRIFIAMLFLFASTYPFAQSKEASTDREAIKQFINNKDTMPALRKGDDVEAVKYILKQYNSAVEKLAVTGSEKMFTPDSKIYESGGSEGNYTHYLEHHLTPELKEFKSFKFSDYAVEVQIDGKYAFTTETYNYTIIVAKDNTEIKRKGVATSVLKKIKGEWKIWISHNSSRK